MTWRSKVNVCTGFVCVREKPCLGGNMAFVPGGAAHGTHQSNFQICNVGRKVPAGLRSDIHRTCGSLSCDTGPTTRDARGKLSDLSALGGME